MSQIHNKMMKRIRPFVIVLLIMVFPMSSHGETNLNGIYGLREKDVLQKIIGESEKTNSSDKDHLKLMGIAYHNLGVLEVKRAPEKAVEYLEKGYSLFPDDYELLVYLGSAKTMVARDSWNVVAKVSGVNRGINMMDKAIKKAPNNIPIRMVRGNNSLKLPKFFNRRPIAKEDFLHVEMLIKNSPKHLPLYIDSDTKAEVFYQLGMIFKLEENTSLSGAYFNKAIEIAPHSQWGAKAKGEL